YNKGLPVNGVWIPQTTIKRKWDIGKIAIRKMIKNGEVESITFNNRLYIKGFAL
ncbi:unnamed protein product, partial [marine sediment metagenome]